MKLYLNKLHYYFIYTFLGSLVFIIVGSLFVTQVSADNANLVAHWKFDETVAGSSAADSVGSNNGTPTNNPTPSTDVPSVSFTDLRSASFNGSNYFTFTRPVSDNFSICAWVRTTSSGGGTNHWESAPIFDSESGGVGLDFGFGVGNGGKLMFGNGGTVSGNLVDRQVNGSTTINDDVWHNVCVTRNNTNGAVKLYVDAQLDGSGTTGTGSLTRNPNVRVGYGYDGAALFNGKIDDIRVYDIVLTQTQLENLTAGSNDPSSPVDNDGISATIEDASPNSGDANGDGTSDSQQASVASLKNTNVSSTAYITVALDNTNCTSLANVSLANQTVTDSGYTYPAGLLNFDVSCNANGDSTTVKVYFDKQYDTSNWIARKYQNSTYKTVSGATFGTATVGGATVSTMTYTLVDGGELDSDGVANKTIVDPVGPAVLTQSSSSSSSGSSGSSSSRSECTNSKPIGIPDLFQINVSSNQAKLYFTPLSKDVTRYYISYGYSSGDERFGTFFNYGSSKGVNSELIQHLAPNTTYYYKVQPYNGCKPGDKSNEMKITTLKKHTGGKIYYKNFFTRVTKTFITHILTK